MSLFVAVWPNQRVIDSLLPLLDPSAPGVRWSAPEQWHCTLAFLGSPPPDTWSALAEPIRHVGDESHDEVVATLGPATSLLGRDVLCVPVSGLDALAAAVRTVVEPLVPTLDRRAFRGHLTLARAQRRHRIPRTLAGRPVEQHFEVSQITLMSSRSILGGVTYELVAGAALAGSA